MKELVQIEFLDIEENEEYSKIIEKVIHKCFEEENMLRCEIELETF